MVVSLANISPTHGSHYYRSEDHLQTPLASSEWSGKLATVLGLQQQSSIQPHCFERLLQGQDRDGLPLINKGRLAHASVRGTARAGIDLTTSAPKSISIQALLFDDLRLIAAHQQATRIMLQLLEERYAMTRITVQGKRLKQFTGELLVAQFHHQSSRALDPQLHSHNVILNLTRGPQGRWGSLDNTAIYSHRLLFDLIYRNALAQIVQQLGYRLRRTQQQYGLWELSGFSDEHIQLFSKRSQQILDAAGEDASARSRYRIAQQSGRQPKIDIQFEQVQAGWRRQAAVQGITRLRPGEFMASSMGLEDVVNMAIETAAQQPKAALREQVESIALSLAVGQYSFSQISQATARLLATGSPDQSSPNVRPKSFSQGVNDDQTVSACSQSGCAGDDHAAASPRPNRHPARSAPAESPTDADSTTGTRPYAAFASNRFEPFGWLRQKPGSAGAAEADGPVAARGAIDSAASPASALQPARRLYQNGRNHRYGSSGYDSAEPSDPRIERASGAAAQTASGPSGTQEQPERNSIQAAPPSPEHDEHYLER